MNPNLKSYIEQEIVGFPLSDERKQFLDLLVHFIQQKVGEKQVVKLHFICTHNSRRSQLSQIWAQVAAHYYGFTNVYCYSGGTEETAVFPMVVEVLKMQGFVIQQQLNTENSLYEVFFDDRLPPIITFSKRIDHPINPSTNFAAILTCSQADEDCPLVIGAEQRIPLTYEDPKISDDTPQQIAVYLQRSKQIAQELFYVFSRV